MIFFHAWLNVIAAVIGFFGTVMLGVSAQLVPWGLRLSKKDRHPFRKKPGVTNGSNQTTTSWQEWWGSYLKVFGWILLSISFFIQIFAAWPIG